MDEQQLAEMAQRHWESQGPVGKTLCVNCRELWPCDVARLAAEVRRLRATQPIVDAALSISTYSRETVDAGLRRVLDACSEYEDALTDHG